MVTSLLIGRFQISLRMVSMLFDAIVPALGWYRAGQGNATFFLAHRTGITFDIENNDATRDDFGEISGTLYDLDTALNDGLSGETIIVSIDGVQVATTVTSITGEYSASIRADSNLFKRKPRHDAHI